MILAGSGIEAYLTYMLIRFGVIAIGIAFLVLIGFTLLLVLKRRGKLSRTREFIEPLARRFSEQKGTTKQTMRGNLGRNVTSAVIKYIDTQTDNERGHR